MTKSMTFNRFFLILFLLLVSILPGEIKTNFSPKSAEKDSEIILHFGYGSNLNINFMRKYCPSTQFFMKAILPNFFIEFPYYSKNLKGGISSIIENPGEYVQGILYKIPKKEMEKLDIEESVPEGLYKRETFMVFGEDGKWYKADLYRVVDTSQRFPPSIKYLEIMIDGAKEEKLDPAYIKKLESLKNLRKK